MDSVEVCMHDGDGLTSFFLAPAVDIINPSMEGEPFFCLLFGLYRPSGPAVILLRSGTRLYCTTGSVPIMVKSDPAWQSVGVNESCSLCHFLVFCFVRFCRLAARLLQSACHSERVDAGQSVATNPFGRACRRP